MQREDPVRVQTANGIARRGFFNHIIVENENATETVEFSFHGNGLGVGGTGGGEEEGGEEREEGWGGHFDVAAIQPW